MARAPDHQPLGLVARIPLRIGIRLVLGGQTPICCVAHAERILRADASRQDSAPTTRGYCGIGAEGVSKSANVGALLRTAHAFGAAFCFTIGAGFDSRAGRQSDTADTPTHVPLWRYPDAGAITLPRECALVGVELLDDAVDLPSFRHPLNAAYVLGPERSGLSPAVLAQCRHVIRIPTRFALNLAIAGAIVLYDRLLQHGRYADRPVASGGPAQPAPPAASHGDPRFRRTMPDWLARPPDRD